MQMHNNHHHQNNHLLHLLYNQQMMKPKLLKTKLKIPGDIRSVVFGIMLQASEALAI